jgi:hypothetical protein
MSTRKKPSRVNVMKKLREFRKRWAGHEGIDTPYGHVLLGQAENGRPRRAQKPLKKTNKASS